MLRAALCAVVVATITTTAAAVDVGTFVWLSDIHLDTLYSPTGQPDTFCRQSRRRQLGARSDDFGPAPFGQYGCDSPALLLNSTLLAATRAAPEADFVLVTGDWAMHQPPGHKDTLRSVEVAATAVASHFPGVPVVPLVGNNDLKNDYEFPLDDAEWLHELADAWGPAVNASLTQQPNSTETFFNGGAFYSFDVGSSLRLVCLNTLLYSVHLTPELHNSSTPDPAGQLAWLGGQMASAQSEGRRVWLVSHVPPGQWTKGGFNEEWKHKYLEDFTGALGEALAAGSGDEVAALLFGHTHEDMQAVLSVDLPGGDAAVLPVLTAGAVTPRDDNNPSFRIGYYDRDTGSLLDYDAWSASIAAVQQQAGGPSGPSVPTATQTTIDDAGGLSWSSEYDFVQAYGTWTGQSGGSGDPLTGQGVEALVQALASDGDLMAAWMARRVAEFTDDAARRQFVCAVQNINAKDFQDCLTRWQHPQP